MKKINLALLAFGVLLPCSALISCSEEFDDSQIQKELTNLDKRVASLETLVNAQNQEISNIQAIITKLENKTYLQSFTTLSYGYRLNFTDGTSLDILNGQDGYTPIIGVGTASDGKYYWTITIDGYTDFITDASGNYLPVTGEKGAIGITPLLQVDADGYWMVSYDNGTSYSYVVDANGNNVSALGEKGDSCIVDIYQQDGYVYITFYDGVQVQLPISSNFGISFSSQDVELFGNVSYVEVSYEITGADSSTFVETIDKGNVKSKVSATSTSEGVITITKTDDLLDDASVLVLLCNRNQTITSVIRIASETDNRLENVVPDEILIKVEQYMPIYRGVNPPNIEGAYALNPMHVIYCEDGGLAQGASVYPMNIRFYGQDREINTISYEALTIYGSTDSRRESASDAFVSGTGKYFTFYCNGNGVYSSSDLTQTVDYKTALVISGEKTSSGIRNMKYAFIMVSKSSDPDNKVMKEGTFRVFGDPDYLSENIEWTDTDTEQRARQVLGDEVYNCVYSFGK